MADDELRARVRDVLHEYETAISRWHIAAGR
ncbi:hypothetical protein [Halogranum rubrum]